MAGHGRKIGVAPMLAASQGGVCLWRSRRLARDSPAISTSRCGNDPATFEQMSVAANLSRIEGDSLLSRLDMPDPIVIPTYFHEEGQLSEARLAEQLHVLNRVYAPHNISFDLKETTRTVNIAWALNSDGLAMRRSLRRGGYDSLNLYFIGFMFALGYCTLPSPEASVEGSNLFTYDGCVMLGETIPGGAPGPYDGGRTTTHEVGHWLHLLHTFDGVCTCVGDLVHDTPAQASDSVGCPIGRDSCPDRLGLDPIHIYMDYTDDVCMEEFPPGQAFRMRAAWYNLRGGKSVSLA
ncbi:metalloprotease 1 precursor [Plectosphaerella plurivora]|uniref:Metalloprotease 1 n=1 Tax=Plectosphaerella plurivora TaxID=936078 RepID=A0A9P8V0U6_9PEZI|nr:metalloprotease 1 precursor [Plectosphaerella plurivora]